MSPPGPRRVSPPASIGLASGPRHVHPWRRARPPSPIWLAATLPSYSLLPADVGQDAEKGKLHIDKSGAAYALVMQITGSEQQISSTPSMHGGFCGPGWGGWGWGWGGGTDIRTDTLVSVQTQLFDLKADKLVWAGQSNTMNPSKAESFARELIRAVGNEMQKAGLVGPPKRS